MPSAVARMVAIAIAVLGSLSLVLFFPGLGLRSEGVEVIDLGRGEAAGGGALGVEPGGEPQRGKDLHAEGACPQPAGDRALTVAGDNRGDVDGLAGGVGEYAGDALGFGERLREVGLGPLADDNGLGPDAY